MIINLSPSGGYSKGYFHVVSSYFKKKWLQDCYCFGVGYENKNGANFCFLTLDDFDRCENHYSTKC